MFPKYYHKLTLADFLSLISGIFWDKSEKAEILLKIVYGDKNIFFFDSGRACLSILLKALNYPKHSEVIVPVNCCPVVPEAIKLNKLVPVYADIDNNLTILPEDIGKKISPRTKAIICVAHYGNVPDYDEIVPLCRKNDVDIIQDLAHTFTAKYNKKYLTEIGIASFFSLGMTKSITTFEGGILLLNDKKIDLSVISRYLRKRESIFSGLRRIASFILFILATRPTVYGLLTKRFINFARYMSFYQPKHRVLSREALALLCNVIPRIYQIENERKNKFREIVSKLRIPQNEIYQLKSNRDPSCLVLPIKKDFFENNLKLKIRAKIDFPEPLPLLKDYYSLNDNFSNAEIIYRNICLMPTYSLNWI